MGKRLNIALMISHLEDDFANAVCRGAIIGAKEIDANLFICPGRYIEGVYDDKKRTEFEYQYNTLFSYAFPDDIDVILVLTGTICNAISYERKKEFLKNLGDIPVINIACEIDGYSSVCFDNKSGIRECIEHLIDAHGCTKIGFVSGPQTNPDANERLGVYRDVLEECGIAYDENRVVYGRFSPYSHEEVRELLDRCDDLEAIVFANDAMVVGAYDVFKERGIEPGKDILVTGFDDSPVASTLMPALTTVGADAAELGYDAVIQCPEILKSKGVSNKLVPSSMVKRRSCGCKDVTPADSNYEDVFVFNHSRCRTDSQTITAITKYLFDNYKSSDTVTEIKNSFVKYLESVFQALRSDDNGKVSLSIGSADVITGGFEDLLTPEVMEYIDHDRICRVINYLSRRFSVGLGNDNDRAKRRLSEVFSNMYQIIMRAAVSYSETRIADIEFLTWQSNSITKDMLLFDTYDDESYGSVSDKIMRLNVGSSYIYVFNETITHRSDQEWSPPSKVLLKSYHNGDIVETIPVEDQELSIRHLFNHQYIPNDRRVTMVLSAIFLNADHYGLFLCEVEHEYFYYINVLSSQLCAAMKILRLIQDKETIRLELENTLMQIRERNLQLDTISKLDELTGVYNRRGFFAQASNMICSPINEGKEALIIFADLDSLKTINDSFSHEDGDFAIRNAAKILTDSFRSSDIIGRIGGDEFSVLAMVEHGSRDEVISIVRSRISASTESFNETHDKPYIVRMSVGVYPFICGPDTELSKILAQADNVLYDEKKKKTSILR